MPRTSFKPSLTALTARLQVRRPDLEQSILARVYDAGDPTALGQQYVDALHRAVAAALDYGLSAIDSEQNGSGPSLPPEVIVQVGLAARNGVSLATVLRGYCGGNTLFTNALVEDAESAGLPAAELKRLFRSVGASLDRLLAVVGEEYAREAGTASASEPEQPIEVLRRLLAGERPDTSYFDYDFGAHHLGIVALGRDSAHTMRALGERTERQLLLLEPNEQTSWAWLGGQRRFDRAELDHLVSFPWPEQAILAFGEPGQGIPGWRLTHRQATAALPIAQRGGEPLVQYADVALLASVIQDDLLDISLRRLYLAPLQHEPDGGTIAKQTLRAYFDADRDTSVAAAALGISHATLSSRLIAIEDSIGRPLETVTTEVRLALHLDGFDSD